MKVTHRTNRVRRNVVAHLKLPPTRAELRKQFMSDYALALKRKTPMFTQ